MKKLFDPSSTVSIAPSTIIFTIFFLLGLWFVFVIRDIVLVCIMALIVMSAFHPGVRWLQKTLRFPKILGIMVSYLSVGVVLALTFVVIVPPLIAEIPTLVHSLSLPTLPVPADIFSLRLSVGELNSLIGQIQGSLGTLYGIVSSTFQGVFNVLTVLVLSAYLLIDRDNLHKRIVWFSKDPTHLHAAKAFVDSLEVQLGGWIRGQLLLMVIIGIITYAGLFALGIPYALPLALLAGSLEILPNLGPTLAALPAMAVAFGLGGLPLSGAVMVFYILMQQVENHFIVPNVMRQNADVSPLVTILVILIGVKLQGIAGALLAVPLYVMIRAIYATWFRDRVLETTAHRQAE